MKPCNPFNKKMNQDIAQMRRERWLQHQQKKHNDRSVNTNSMSSSSSSTTTSSTRAKHSLTMTMTAAMIPSTQPQTHNKATLSSFSSPSAYLEFDRLYYPNRLLDHIDLPTFLAMFPPGIDIPGCNWIQVENIANKDETTISAATVTSTTNKESQHEILLEMARLYNKKRMDKSIKESYMKRLCDAATNTCGKWLVFAPPSKIENIWNAIATKVVEGELGCSAKVRNPKATNQVARTLVICVYVDNFQDRDDVRRVLRTLLRIKGVYVTSGFKVRNKNLGNENIKEHDYAHSQFSKFSNALSCSMSNPNGNSPIS